MSNTAVLTYPKQHEALLRKAGLIGTGKLEIRGIHRIREHEVSEDGLTYTKVRRPDEEDILTGGSHVVFNDKGQIAGYWANGLTKEEVDTIHNECNVPLYYLGRPVNPMTGKPDIPDSYIHISEGEVLDLSIPAQMAKAMLLMQMPGLIGINKQDASENDAYFFFYSVVEEQKEKKLEIKERMDASKLVGELTKADKKETVQIMSHQGALSVDPYITEENAAILFDELCFTMPKQVLIAYNQERKADYICIHTLISSGHIDTATKDGPYYKNPVIYGQRTHLADTETELMKRIVTFPDLMKSYKEIQSYVDTGTNREAAMTNSLVQDLLSQHMPKTDEVDEDEAYTIKNLNKASMFKLMADRGISHTFTNDSDIKEIKEYYLENLDN